MPNVTEVHGLFEYEVTRRSAVHDLLLKDAAIELVAYPDETDPILQHLYVHVAGTRTVYFVGVCAKHNERVLFNAWLGRAPCELFRRRDFPPQWPVRWWPDVPGSPRNDAVQAVEECNRVSVGPCAAARRGCERRFLVL